MMSCMLTDMMSGTRRIRPFPCFSQDLLSLMFLFFSLYLPLFFNNGVPPSANAVCSDQVLLPSATQSILLILLGFVKYLPHFV